MQNYEINRNTLAIIPITKEITKIIEEDRDFIINLSSMQIIDDSCKYFGSSYEGRVEGTKNILGLKIKSPIFIEESSDLIFFPTKSPRNWSCVWINLNKIDDYEKVNSSTTKIFFSSGKAIKFNISYEIIDNQVLRATRLCVVFNKRRKNFEKNG